MCRYCKPIRNGDFASPIKRIKWPKSTLQLGPTRAQILNEQGVDNVKAIILYYGSADQPMWSYCGVPVKYCPWCGKKLEKV